MKQAPTYRYLVKELLNEYLLLVMAFGGKVVKHLRQQEKGRVLLNLTPTELHSSHVFLRAFIQNVFQHHTLPHTRATGDKVTSTILVV
jgi:hypothetical protein